MKNTLAAVLAVLVLAVLCATGASLGVAGAARPAAVSTVGASVPTGVATVEGNIDWP
ncbi:hypothetical protein AB0E96_27270 [Kitasatospora sp. NPDC036755]|uniref:hypothetical protein n=1 Tax=Kitasatospora sp. NPDC036755 TaxID=3154600 RepID=UPI0033C94048